ncbi:MAG: polyribonucleotide nucleotidyltransferase [Candidatus Hydrothermia bacterium]|nr:polyribonucleotide nucleotidyltransferase [Candidatus Hydrothermia bacterium]MDD5572851.1 polyribonucleotide nucleotidyltransferase [Candidatus Hydrothermia bacterium]HOK23007.1 polyribonucleotide nucleotidyltransferase [Candidatus Hydrothermia bacterium]HOL23733.1 polyribonucleotide nucleotidyltransferase [Candidatus Hydrothermia bacterium]HPO78738.1 polyribonucleotide nucleotidyltransferase [Candidatus Hydrothermia bacterium]
MIFTLEHELAGHKLKVEIGRVANQATSSLLISYGDTVLLVTAVIQESTEKRDFLPLLVEYREQSYAAGKIPGGYFKREGKPTEREILHGRAIDRAIRPRFPKDMVSDIEVTTFLLSYDLENDSNFLGIVGASACLHVSEIEFDGPIAACRVGRIGGKFVINPTNSEIEKSDFDMLLAGSSGEINMIEFGGKEVPEDIVLSAIEFALPYLKEIEDFQNELREKVGKTKAPYQKLEISEEFSRKIEEFAFQDIFDAMHITDRRVRNEALKEVRNSLEAYIKSEYPQEDFTSELDQTLYELEKRILREMVLKEKRRVDGRRYEDIRPITCEVGVLPRTHGSAIFRRGETQTLVVTTLGTGEDVQKLSELEPEEEKRFMLHYNFPPFSTGEVKPLRGVSRREVGHGNLAEKALAPLIPQEDVFPYTIRVVSDVLESNGSTSMATVCGGSLSLMDAGVPIKSACAGISTGLVKDGDEYVLLTDIVGAEDHYGDMDFKVAGTEKGITAIQLDLKIRGLTMGIIGETFQRAKEARVFILEIMNTTLNKPRESISVFAPKVSSITVPIEKIGLIIGPGGRNIKKITEQTGTKIEIEDGSGRVLISGYSQENVEEAKEIISGMVQEVELGKIYMGVVKRVVPFGAFVEVLPGKEGLLHISEIADTRINKVEDVLKVGDKVLVKVIGIDENGKFKLSRKQAMKAGMGTSEEDGTE